MEIPGIIDKYPSLSKGARVLIFRGGNCQELTVFKVVGINVFMKSNSEIGEQIFNNNLSESVLVDVQFLMNRWVITCLLRAIQKLQSHVVRSLFPPHEVRLPSCPEVEFSIKLYNQTIAGNREQKQAVCNIVKGSSG
jgi:hypothetical protein